MDPSQEIGDYEEYSSSESGWTKYIISHLSDDDDDEEDCNESEGDKNAIDDDDDSMVSDASTGPGRNKHYDEKDDAKMIKDDNVKGSLYSCMKIIKKEEKALKEKKRDVKRNTFVSLRISIKKRRNGLNSNRSRS